MSGWTIAWLLWIAAFFAIELPALLNKQRGDTLSEHIWQWFAVKWSPRTGVGPHGSPFVSVAWVYLRRGVLALFLVWLLLHLLGGGR